MKSNQKHKMNQKLSPQAKENYYRTYSSGSDCEQAKEEIKDGINFQYQDDMQNMIDAISMPNQSMSMSNLSQISQSPFNGGIITPQRSHFLNYNQLNQNYQQQNNPLPANVTQQQSSATKLSTFISQLQKSSTSQSQSSLMSISNEKITNQSETFMNNYKQDKVVSQSLISNTFRSQQDLKLQEKLSIQRQNESDRQNQQILNGDYNKCQNPQANPKNRTFADSVLLQGMISQKQSKQREDLQGQKSDRDYIINKQTSTSPLSAIRHQFVQFNQENGENQNQNLNNFLNKADMSAISNLTAITGAPSSLQFRMNIPKTPDRSDQIENIQNNNSNRKQNIDQINKKQPKRLIIEDNISDMGLSQLLIQNPDEKQELQLYHINNNLEKSEYAGFSDISAMYPNKSPFVMRFNINQDKELVQPNQNQLAEDKELKEALQESNSRQINLPQSPDKIQQVQDTNPNDHQFQKQESQKLRVELSISKCEITKLKNLLLNNSQEIQEINIKNKKSQLKMIDLESKVQEVSDQNRTLQQSQKDHSQLPQFLSRAQENARREIQCVKQQLSDKDFQIQELQRQLQVEQSKEPIEKQSFIRQIEDLCEQIDSERLISVGVKNKLLQMESAFAQKEETMINTYKQDICNLNDKCRQFENYIQQIIKEYQEKEEELQSVFQVQINLQNQLQISNNQNQLFNQEVENLKARCQALERELEIKSNVNINKNQQKDFEFEINKQRETYVKQVSFLKEEKQQLQYQLQEYVEKFNRMNIEDQDAKLKEQEKQIIQLMEVQNSIQQLLSGQYQSLQNDQEPEIQSELLQNIKSIQQQASQSEIYQQNLINIQQEFSMLEKQLKANEEIKISLQKDVLNLQKQLEQGPSSFTKGLLLDKDKEIQELKQEIKSERIQTKSAEEKLWHCQKFKEIGDLKQVELTNNINQQQKVIDSLTQDIQNINKKQEFKDKQITDEIKDYKMQISQLQKNEIEQQRNASESLIETLQLKNKNQSQINQIEQLQKQLQDSQIINQQALSQQISSKQVESAEISTQCVIETLNKYAEACFDKQSDIDGLKQTVDYLNQQVETLQNENKDMESEYQIQTNQLTEQYEQQFQLYSTEIEQSNLQLLKYKDMNYELSKELKIHQQKVQIMKIEENQLHQQIQKLQENEHNLIQQYSNNQNLEISQKSVQTETNFVYFNQYFQKCLGLIKSSKNNFTYIDLYVVFNTIVHGNTLIMQYRRKLFSQQLVYPDILSLMQLFDFNHFSHIFDSNLQQILYFFLCHIFNRDKLMNENNFKNQAIYQADFEEEISQLNQENQDLQNQLEEAKLSDQLLKEEFKQIIEGLEQQKLLLEKEFENKIYKCKKESEIEFKIKYKEQQQNYQLKINEIQNQATLKQQSLDEQQIGEQEQIKIQFQKQIQELVNNIESLEDELSFQKQKELAQKDIDNFKQVYNQQSKEEDSLQFNGILQFENILDLEFQKILLSLKMKSQNMSIDELNQKRNQLNKNIQKLLNDQKQTINQNDQTQGNQLKSSVDNIKKMISEVLKLFKDSLESKNIKKIQGFEQEIIRLNSIIHRINISDKKSNLFQQNQNNKVSDEEVDSKNIEEIFKFLKDLQMIYVELRQSKVYKLCIDSDYEINDLPTGEVLENIKQSVNSKQIIAQTYRDLLNSTMRVIQRLNQGTEQLQNETNKLKLQNQDLSEQIQYMKRQRCLFIDSVNGKQKSIKEFFEQLTNDESIQQLFSDQSQSLIIKTIDISDCIEKLISIQNGIIGLFIIDNDQYKLEYESKYPQFFQKIQDSEIINYELFKANNFILNRNIAEINQKCLNYTIEMIDSNNENENTFSSDLRQQANQDPQTSQPNYQLQMEFDNQQIIPLQLKNNSQEVKKNNESQDSKYLSSKNCQVIQQTNSSLIIKQQYSQSRTEDDFQDQLTPKSINKSAQGTIQNSTINLEKMSQDQAVNLLAKVFQKLNLTGINEQQSLRQLDQNSCQDGLLNNTATTANILGGLKVQYENRSVFASQDYCRKLPKQNNQKFISQQFISENTQNVNQNNNQSQVKQQDANESVHQSLESIQPSQNTVQSAFNHQNYNYLNSKDNDDCIKQAESLLKMFKQSQDNQKTFCGKNLQSKLFIQTQQNLPLQQERQGKTLNQNLVASSVNAARQQEYLATPTNISIISQKQQNSLYQKNSIPLPQQLMKNNFYSTNQKQFKQSADPNTLQLREQSSQNSQIKYQKLQKSSQQLYDQQKTDIFEENQKFGQFENQQRNQSENKFINDQIRKNSIKSGNNSLSNTNNENNRVQKDSMNLVKDYYNFHNQNKTIEVEQNKQSNFEFYSCNDEKQLLNEEHSDVRRKLLQRIEGVVSPISSYKNMQLYTSAENFVKRQEYKSSERTIDQTSGITTSSAQIELKPQNWHRMNSAKALPQKNNNYKFQTVEAADNSTNLLSKRQMNFQQKMQRPNLPKSKIYQNNIQFEQQQQKQQQQITFRHRQNEMQGIQQQKQQQPTQKQQMKQYRYQQDKNSEFEQLKHKNGDYELNQDEFISNQSSKNNFVDNSQQETNKNYYKVSQFQTIQEKPKKLYKQNFFNVQQNESLKNNLLSIDSAGFQNKNQIYSNQKHQLFFNDEDEVPTVNMEDLN